VSAKVASHPKTDIAVAVISIEEQLTGWYTYVRRAKKPADLASAYDKLAKNVECLAGLRILPLTLPAIARYEQLKKLKLGVRKPDLRIAAIVLEHDATIVTRNVQDFQRVPGLKIENWAE
jgi:tRNA(fMet)-specific endonuclease VapC